jgi:hypothetical protein
MGIPIWMWMHHAHLRKLVVNWFRRSQGELVGEFTIFDNFVSLWISFDAWGTYQSREDRSRKMIEWVKSNETLKEKFVESFKKDSNFVQDVRALIDLCPIHRHKPYKDSTEVNIKSINDFDNVLEAIYQIRCNFLHGHAAFDDKRNQTLIELAFRILSKLFSGIVKELSSSDW